MSKNGIVELERQIGELIAELTRLRKASPGTPVPDYTFRTQHGDATLRDLFGDRDKLLAIHNMGQGGLHPRAGRRGRQRQRPRRRALSARRQRHPAGTPARSVPATCIARCGGYSGWQDWTRPTGRPSSTTGSAPRNSTTAERTCSTEAARP